VIGKLLLQIERFSVQALSAIRLWQKCLDLRVEGFEVGAGLIDTLNRSSSPLPSAAAIGRNGD
jgi:hypothetical protein